MTTKTGRKYYKEWYAKNKDNPEFKRKQAEKAKLYRAKKKDCPEFKRKNIENNRRWRAANPDKVVAGRLRYSYGITPDYRASIIEKQGGICAICCSAPATDVDHCHTTKVVRGVLCPQCNMAIGLLKDRTDVLLRAADYLHAHAKTDCNAQKVA